METKNVWSNPDIITTLQHGGVVVMPTDTIYGMVTPALNETAVERIYTIRKRAPDKPCIVLIGDSSGIEKFGVTLSGEQKNALQKYWSFDSNQNSRPTSIVLDCDNDSLVYLHRGTKTLAFRLPQSKDLRDLLLKTGPLIAPSANTEKFPASETIEDAKAYFGDAVDLYIDGGPIVSQASKVVRLNLDGSTITLRE